MMKKEYASYCLEMMEDGHLGIPTTPLNGVCYKISCAPTAKYAESEWAFTLILAEALSTVFKIRTFPVQHDIFVVRELEENEFRRIVEKTYPLCDGFFFECLADGRIKKSNS